MFCGDTHVQRSNMASVTQHTMIIHTAHESRKLDPSSKANCSSSHKHMLLRKQQPPVHSVHPPSLAKQAMLCWLLRINPLSDHLSNELNHCKVPSILCPLFPHSLFLHKTMLKLCCSVLCRPVLCHLLMPLLVRTGGLAPLGW